MCDTEHTNVQSLRYSEAVIYTSFRRARPKRRSPVQLMPFLAGSSALRLHTLSVPCTLCNNPVRLERAGTDQDGKPVHEQCYLKKLIVEAQASKNRQSEKSN
jgi:hypothetical protein